MGVKTVYLDSSSILKRYIEEKASDVIDEVYEKAEAGKLKLAFSIWNVGEIIGVLDRHVSRRLISAETFRSALSKFILESMKMVRLGSLQIMPITSKSLSNSWLLITKHHIYEADALQISTSLEAECNFLFSADADLVPIAERENIKAVNIEAEPERALEILREGTEAP
jgi:predicted nucleic acid-binding protein